jgi:uncharacterized phage protein (TIGR02220 family)
MFSKKVIGSSRFLKMPVSSQALYFHLGLHADDDGVVEAWAVMRSCGASEDDLRVLVSKGFVIVLNEDLVAYLTDWNVHNNIRADRKVDSIYRDLLLQIVPDAQLKDKKPRSDVKHLPMGQTMDGQWTDNGQSTDGHLPADGRHRIGKDRIGKVSLVEYREEEGEEETADEPPAPPLHNQSTPYEQVKDLYNQICVSLPKCTTLSDARKKAIKARMNSGYTLEDFQRLFEKTEASSFMKGANERNWRASFDWLIKDSNMAKVLDGNYDDRGHTIVHNPKPAQSSGATFADMLREEAAQWNE